jgi:hypothetical protein
LVGLNASSAGAAWVSVTTANGALLLTPLGDRAITRVVVVALIVFALSRFVPLAALQLYVQGVAAMVALWPFAYAMRTEPAPYATGASRPVRAS